MDVQRRPETENGMPTIRITQPPGQSPAVTETMMKSVTAAYVETTGSKPASVWVMIDEVAREQWAIGGETLAERAAKA